MVAINPSGTRGAALTNEGLQVWETATGRLLNKLDLASGPESAAPFEQVGRRPSSILMVN